MRLNQLWRITTFRLTVLYGLLFAFGMIALLGLVYLQSSVYLTQRVDGILKTEADALTPLAPLALKDRIGDALTLNGDKTNVFAVFTAKKTWIAGNLRALPPGLKIGGRPLEVALEPQFPAHTRLIARRLPSGAVLVVGRDISQLREMRQIIASALVWSGAITIVVIGGLAVILSVGPLRRLQVLQAAGREIAAGDLKRRMPTSTNNDELDMFASTVNFMMDEVERLMMEVRGVTETVAHDLRTPLTRARAQLHRLQQDGSSSPADLARVTAELDVVLERFRALLRISELEGRERQAGFQTIDLAAIVAEAVELYQPLAEAGSVRLNATDTPSVTIEADPKLLFEAVSNLVDNAIKFSSPGGSVMVGLGDDPTRPRIIVQDDGPGVAKSERSAVLQRFYRSPESRLIPGSGLGLSIVSAIMRLHRFELILHDAEPGLIAVIECRPVEPTH
jgi:signal transduction histidine kinase